jgi:inner membrane protein
MLFPTHLAFAALVGLLSMDIFPVQNKFLFFTLVLLGGVLPDIDKANSKLGKKLGPVSKGINVAFGHRGFFHSFMFLISGYLILLMLTSKVIAFAFFMGVLSHLAIDSITPMGVAFFYPLKKHRFSGPVPTGDFGEKVVFLLILTSLVAKVTTGHFLFFSFL